MPDFLKRWRQRHQHPVSLALHLVAIPLLPLAGALVIVQLIDGAWSLWWRPVLLLVVSYVLQGIGHWIEGNDMGELILIKKWLGKPFVAVSPRYAAMGSSEQAARKNRAPAGSARGTEEPAAPGDSSP